MEVPGRSQVPPHGYSLVSDGDHCDFRGLRNKVKMRSMVKMKTERLVMMVMIMMVMMVVMVILMVMVMLMMKTERLVIMKLARTAFTCKCPHDQRSP